MRRVLFVVGFAILVCQPLAAQETIGPFDIAQAPVSATGSVGATWGNVVNTPVTVNEAFSGFSIIDDGFINISTGDFYEVTFNPPVVNVTGPDIVVFDARYDAGAYTLSTSYDGFSASFVPSSWVDSGVDRLYYYGGAGQDLFGWRAPNGYPDFKEDWQTTSSLLYRWRTINWLVTITDDADNYRLDVLSQTPGNVLTPNELANFWIDRILGRPMSSFDRQEIVDFMAQGHNPDYDLPLATDEDVQDRLRSMVALIMMSPDFQWR